jgi:FMN-dependent NADH-azoreductase
MEIPERSSLACLRVFGKQEEKLSISICLHIISKAVSVARSAEKRNGALSFSTVCSCSPKIEKADGIILGSPTYNYNMTPWMKAFIDRLYPYFDFSQQRPGPYSSRLSGKGKKALVFGVCEQIDPKEMGYTIVAMRDAIKVVGYEIFAELAFPAHFYPGSVAKDPSSREKAESAGKAFTASFQGTIA